MGKKQDGYRHITKDPMIDVIRTEAQRAFGTDNLHEQELKEMSKKAGSVTTGTLRNWFFGTTRRPHGFNMRMALESIGVKTRLYRADGTEIRMKGLHEK
jgi:hypothetical protein